MSVVDKDLYKTIKYLKECKFDQWNKLANFIVKIDHDNIYGYESTSKKAKMWREQCYINFPLLYLTSIYLYIYAKQKDCNVFLFATRDCSHLHKIFRKMFPNEEVHYFNCSRLMFEKATSEGNKAFKEYVKTTVSNITKTIFVDLHGTGKRVFSYFEKEFNEVPQCLILSIGCADITGLPEITRHYNEQNKFHNLVNEARGSPIEMLNYDLIGTMVDYSELLGPVRNKLEYCGNYIKPYHECISFIINKLNPFEIETIESLQNITVLRKLIVKIYKRIRNSRPSISEHIDHLSKHIAIDDNIHDNFIARILFNTILNDTGIYGIIWDGMIDDKPCAIKMVSLTSGEKFKENPIKYKNNMVKPFLHDAFLNHKSMTKDAFLYEANQLLNLSKIGLAPNVNGFWICDSLHNIHYGFIVMDKMDSSLKSIISKRSLSEKETNIVETLINETHTKGIIHGDLKPSNIGVLLNPDQEIIKCLMLDTQKIKYRDSLSTDKFKSLINRDWHNYRKHFIQNTQN